MSCAVPRLMNSPKTVTEQILGIQTFDVLHFFREMTLWGVVAEYMLDNVPGFLAASNNPSLKLAEWFGIRIVLDVGICENLPYISAHMLATSNISILRMLIDSIPE